MSIEKRVGFCTLGCRVNQYETEAIREKLLSLGFTEAPFEEKCDVYVVNTCAVTGESARKSRQIIRRALKRKEEDPAVLVCVTGCFVQAKEKELQSDPVLSRADLLCGNREKPEFWKMIAEKADRAENERSRETKVGEIAKDRAYPALFTEKSPNTRAFVKIEDGCDSFCSYCIVPFVRGRVVSRPAADVEREVRALTANGYREIVLTGIETGLYGDGGLSLASLAARLSGIPGVERIRFGSLKPDVFTEDFCRAMAAIPAVAPNFHLSFQSGSDAVLSAMRRRYTSSDEREAVRRIYAAFPDAGLSADLICGFPGETEEDFEATAALVRETGLLHAHIFPYSPRENTLAAKMPAQVPEDVKKDRCRRLLETARASSRAFIEKRRGAKYRVLCEKWENGFAFGYTESFLYTKTPVAAPPERGSFFEAEIEGFESFSTESPLARAKFLQKS